jgi:hypothetical protein
LIDLGFKKRERQRDRNERVSTEVMGLDGRNRKTNLSATREIVHISTHCQQHHLGLMHVPACVHRRLRREVAVG